MSEFHTFTVDYRKRDGRGGTLLDRGFWVHGIPRPLLTCRVLGHKPVVDSAGDSRWVCCDRCGVRPDGQGNLDPAEWSRGDPYVGEWGPPPEPFRLTKDIGDYEKPKRLGHSLPGPWPTSPRWVFGGQAIIGRTHSTSVEVKVGNCGSEHTLAAHITLGRLGGLFLHTERLGTWLQRRLNPTGYESRVTGASISHGRLDWNLWAARDGSEKPQPRWQHGSFTIDPRTLLFGPVRNTSTHEGGPVPVTVWMPHGDDYQVTVQLERWEIGRTRLKRRTRTWHVGWSGGPIPTKPGGRGRIFGSGVTVSDASVSRGTWPLEAAANIATTLTAWRTREGMTTIEDNADV